MKEIDKSRSEEPVLDMTIINYSSSALSCLILSYAGIYYSTTANATRYLSCQSRLRNIYDNLTPIYISSPSRRHELPETFDAPKASKMYTVWVCVPYQSLSKPEPGIRRESQAFATPNSFSAALASSFTGDGIPTV